jgi:hypothetical protein
MDGWIDGWMDRWMGGWMDGWIDGWIDGWMDGWTDGSMDGWMEFYTPSRYREITMFAFNVMQLRSSSYECHKAIRTKIFVR